MSKIKQVTAIEILDSRGNPTIEAEIILTTGQKGCAAVPSGASTGSREAVELRDKEAGRYFGKGVLKAVAFVNGEIASALKGFDVTDQEKIDTTLITLDGTPNKERLGANALLAVSLAAAKASAAYQDKPLYLSLSHQTETSFTMPVPMMNIINGGAHADNNIDIQEFLILPVGAPTFAEAVRWGTEVFHHLKKILNESHLNTSVGDEGGFAPDLPNNETALDMIVRAIERAGFRPGKDIFLGLDVASSELYREGKYYLQSEKAALNASEFVNYLASLADHFPILSIEDGMAENDWEGWALLTQQLGKKVQLIGDDLFVTNTEIFKQGILKKIANAILIKPNQIGTLTETLNAIQMAKDARYNTIISHRSGETEDTTIADLAVATHAGQIKTGSLCRSDRVAKYNRLLRIAAELGARAHYAGANIFSHFDNLKTSFQAGVLH